MISIKGLSKKLIISGSGVDNEIFLMGDNDPIGFPGRYENPFDHPLLNEEQDKNNNVTRGFFHPKPLDVLFTFYGNL